MTGTLSSMSDEELERVRARFEQLMRTGTSEQRMAITGKLEAIDIERERRMFAGSPRRD